MCNLQVFIVRCCALWQTCARTICALPLDGSDRCMLLELKSAGAFGLQSLLCDMQALRLAYRAVIVPATVADVALAIALCKRISKQYRSFVCNLASSDTTAQASGVDGMPTFVLGQLRALLPLCHTFVLVRSEKCLPSPEAHAATAAAKADGCATVACVHAQSTERGSQPHDRPQDALQCDADTIVHLDGERMRFRGNPDGIGGGWCLTDASMRILCQHLGLIDAALQLVRRESLANLATAHGGVSLPGVPSSSREEPGRPDLAALSSKRLITLELLAPGAEHIDGAAAATTMRGAAAVDASCCDVQTTAELACHLARHNTTASSLTAPGLEAGAAATLAECFSRNPHSKLRSVQLGSTPLPTTLALQSISHAPSSPRKGASKAAEGSCYRISGATLAPPDLAYVTALLGTDAARSRVKHVEIYSDVHAAPCSVLQIAAAITALPRLESVQGAALCELQPRRGVLCVEGSQGGVGMGVIGAAVLVQTLRTWANAHVQVASAATTTLAPSGEHGSHEPQAEALRAADLTGAGFGAEGSTLVADALREFGREHADRMQLVDVRLAATAPGEAGLRAWCRLLSSEPVSASLLSVDLSRTGLGDHAAAHLLEQLGACTGTLLAEDPPIHTWLHCARKRARPS